GEARADDDVYGWSWPARLSGEDPYEWRGPVGGAAPLEAEAETTVPPDMTRPEPAPPAMSVTAPPAPEPKETIDGAGEMWVELPAEAEIPAKPRRTRVRARAKAAPEEVAPARPDLDGGSEAAARPVEPAVSKPVLALAASAPLPPLGWTDPAEILAPPAAPKRGWWRRGA
ncbi:MAG: hypothetical protein ACR2FH_11270, partial [Caulobacteraceae bacterium]